MAHGSRSAAGSWAPYTYAPWRRSPRPRWQLGETELLTAERAARELVAAEPLSEGATALLMRALDARGERPAALVVYDEFRLRLREALGVAPGPQLLALHSELVMR